MQNKLKSTFYEIENFENVDKLDMDEDDIGKGLRHLGMTWFVLPRAKVDLNIKYNFFGYIRL